MGIGAFSLRPVSLLFGHTASKESLSVFRLTVLFDLKLSPEHTKYVPIPDWRNADAALWSKARWINGMAAAHAGITETGKTIVCGHWRCSFGHAKYEGKGGEFDNDPDFSPYCAKGILAIDACTAVSGKVNCIVIDD